jgi:cobalt/nickel transport system permease protein
MENKVPSFLLQEELPFLEASHAGRLRRSFMDVTLNQVARLIKLIHMQAGDGSGQTAASTMNPLVKVISFVYLIVVISLTHRIVPQTVITAFILLLYAVSAVNILFVYRKILQIVLFFGLIVFLPATLNVFSPGDIIIPLFSSVKPHHLWIYTIPAQIGITEEGCRLTGLLLLRMFNSVALTMLVVYSTSLPRLIKAFRILF